MKLWGEYQSVLIGTGDTLILPANAHRRSITISNSHAATIALAFGRAAATNTDMFLNTLGFPMIFNEGNVGDLITGELHGIATVANPVAVTCSYEADDSLP